MSTSPTVLSSNSVFEFDPPNRATLRALGPYVVSMGATDGRPQPRTAALELHPLDAERQRTPGLEDEAHRWTLRRVELHTSDSNTLIPLSALTPLSANNVVIQARDNEQDTLTGLKARMALFNVVVALEWAPSAAYLAGLCRVFARVSKLLLDVTDGYMAIGQVVVGGVELMQVADIQIFASNRLLPRSAVFGMFDVDEYRPIRLGRGLWDKREDAAIPWTEEHGALVHEWGHYALGLKDQYLGRAKENPKLIVPEISLTIDSIMASATSSELLGTNIKNLPLGSEWEQLARRVEQFGYLGIVNHVPEKDPPALVPRPVVYGVGRWDRAAELRLPLTPEFPQDIDTKHCWIYLLREQRLIQQGTLDEKIETGGMLLLGAQVGDSVVLLGRAKEGGMPCVYKGEITGDIGAMAQVGPWGNVTPEDWPIVAVLPGEQPKRQPDQPLDQRKTDSLTVAVRTVSDARQFVFPEAADAGGWSVEVFPLGDTGPTLPKDGTYLVPSLDGIVLLRRGEKLAICHYAQGGSPDGGYPANPNPLPSGSGEGNAMIFSYDEALMSAENPRTQLSGDSYRIVTTTNYHVPVLDGRQPRSYVFAVASNFPLTDGAVQAISPTLILFFDDEEVPELCRLRGRDWENLGGTSSDELYYVATSLSEETMPGLNTQGTAEFFRLLRGERA